MNMIFLGDIVGKGGRRTVQTLVPELKREFNAQFVVANAENCAAGNGLTGRLCAELLTVCDVLTSGDHVWDQKGFDSEIAGLDRVLRPGNLSNLQPGRGCGVFRNPAGGDVAVINLMGKVFMRDSAYCPFETAERLLAGLPPGVKTIFVDLHAEATSEKIAMAEFLDGRVTAVFGTHTHAPTADARVLAGGTAAITDAGMCGALHSVLGRDVKCVLRKFRTGMPARLDTVETGRFRLDGALVTYDYQTGRASAIRQFSREMEVES